MADVVIIGAGAAGLFCAGWAVRASHRVTVLEHMPTPGRKLLITGKGRCNLTNACDEQEFLKHRGRTLCTTVHRRFCFSRKALQSVCAACAAKAGRNTAPAP